MIVEPLETSSRLDLQIVQDWIDSREQLMAATWPTREPALASQALEALLRAVRQGPGNFLAGVSRRDPSSSQT
jgi:hypothetical protein